MNGWIMAIKNKETKAQHVGMIWALKVKNQGVTIFPEYVEKKWLKFKGLSGTE